MAKENECNLTSTISLALKFSYWSSRWTKWSLIYVSSYIGNVVDRARLALNQFTVIDNKIVINYYQYLTFKSSWIFILFFIFFFFSFLNFTFIPYLSISLLVSLPNGRWSSPLGAFTSPRRRGEACAEQHRWLWSTIGQQIVLIRRIKLRVSEWTVEYYRGHYALDIINDKRIIIIIIHGHNKKRSQNFYFYYYFFEWELIKWPILRDVCINSFRIIVHLFSFICFCLFIVVFLNIFLLSLFHFCFSSFRYRSCFIFKRSDIYNI